MLNVLQISQLIYYKWHQQIIPSPGRLRLWHLSLASRTWVSHRKRGHDDDDDDEDDDEDEDEEDDDDDDDDDGHNDSYYSGVDSTNYLDNYDVVNGKVIGTYPAKIGLDFQGWVVLSNHSTWFTYFDA